MTSEPEPQFPRAGRRVRLAYLVSHPIQYQAPLLRRIAQEPDIDLTVFFGSDFSVRGYRDEGFGVGVRWDVPLLDGYKHELLPRLRDGQDVGVMTPLNRGIVSRLRGRGGDLPFDALWVHGYAGANSMHGMIAAKALGIPVLLRAESWLRDRGRSGVMLTLKNLFFAGLKPMVDGVLPIGTLNAEYWRHYFGDDVPQFLMPYAVDNGYFAQRAREALEQRGVRREREVLDAERRHERHQLGDARVQQRLAPRDAHAAHARLHERADHGLPGLVAQALLEVAVVARGAAVHARQVAAIGQRDAHRARLDAGLDTGRDPEDRQRPVRLSGGRHERRTVANTPPGAAGFTGVSCSRGAP